MKHKINSFFLCFIFVFLSSSLSYGDIRDSNLLMICRNSSGAAALDACNKVILEMPAGSSPDLLAEVHAAKGVLLGELGRTDEALYELKYAVKLSPENPKFQYNMGVALEEKGRDWWALVAYRKAAELDPKMKDAWVNVGMAAHRTGRHREATTAFETVLQIDPSYFDNNLDQREAWEISKNVRPASIAFNREISFRLSSGLGTIFKFDDSLKPHINQFVFIMPDAEFDIQIYKRVFATAAFDYVRANASGVLDIYKVNGAINIYGISFGAKYVSKYEKPIAGGNFMDNSRYWIAAAVGPYITDINLSSSAGGASVKKTNVGLNFGAGFDYYVHPNIGLGLQVKMHYVRFGGELSGNFNGSAVSVNYNDDYMIFSAGPVLSGRF